jgi:hypothetical protein
MSRDESGIYVTESSVICAMISPTEGETFYHIISIILLVLLLYATPGTGGSNARRGCDGTAWKAGETRKRLPVLTGSSSLILIF